MKTATLLALLAVTPALAGCDIIDIFTGKKTKGQIAYENQQSSIATQAEMHAHNQALLATIGGVPVDAEPPAPELVPVVVEPPAPPPAPVYEYDRYNADPTGYVCEPIFRQISCLDDGTPVYLDNQMAQLPFGVHP